MKQFFLKFALFLAVVMLLQYAFYAAVAYRWYGGQRGILNLVDQHLADAKEVLYFGDSTICSLCPDDQDQRTLFEAVRDLLPDVSMGEVAHPAFSLTQYELLCRYLSQQPNHPRALLIPINLRSFSTSWDLRPDWQFQRLKLYVDYDQFLFRVFLGPLTKFRAPAFNLTPITMGDYLSAPVYDGTDIVGRVKDFYIDFGHPPEHPDIARQFIFCYMQSILSEDRKVRSLREILRTARGAGMTIIPYVTPIDYQSGIGYLGERFDTRVRENVAMLQSIVQQEGTVLLDFSRLLPSSAFCPPPFMPNDHMTSEGRAILADHLAAAVVDLNSAVATPSSS